MLNKDTTVLVCLESRQLVVKIMFYLSDSFYECFIEIVLVNGYNDLVFVDLTVAV